MSYLERIGERLEELEDRQLRRSVRVESDYAAGRLIDFSSNDYLGLSQHPAVLAALHRATRVGSGGSRLLAGAFAEHHRLEEDLAAYVGREKALVFSSGYHAAIGTIAALGSIVRTCYSDELNHACLIDGARIARVERRIYSHGGFGDARLSSEGAEESALVLTESIFGMDGDAIDLVGVVSAMRPGDVLLIDEAHALGVAGDEGRGLAYGLEDPRVLVMGTLSKAFGSLGGFVAGPHAAIAYLQSVARTFIFDTALPPALAEAARIAVGLARERDAERAKLHDLGEKLRAGLRARGFRVPAGIGAVVPIIVGAVPETLELAARLRGAGINVPPIRPPTVPPGTSRLRVTLRSTHTEADIDRLLSALDP